jgi:signal transduction histidine kinase
MGIGNDLLQKLNRGQVESVGKENGHGIGLKGVFQVLKRLNGSWHIRSDVGVGTVFEINF